MNWSKYNKNNNSINFSDKGLTEFSWDNCPQNLILDITN